ncbi:MAG: hypothetical protein J2P37_22465 [Ktedonobacteraceae bacterium]|nr:hypothetical protein [Ktedonobacteraceae bacterium]MBO0795138.1 hypothetical protein [Ktedonobacteraceae bacterium]
MTRRGDGEHFSGPDGGGISWDEAAKILYAESKTESAKAASEIREGEYSTAREVLKEDTQEYNKLKQELTDAQEARGNVGVLPPSYVSDMKTSLATRKDLLDEAEKYLDQNRPEFASEKLGEETHEKLYGFDVAKANFNHYFSRGPKSDGSGATDGED